MEKERHSNTQYEPLNGINHGNHKCPANICYQCILPGPDTPNHSPAHHFNGLGSKHSKIKLTITNHNPTLRAAQRRFTAGNLSTLTNLKKPAEISNSKMDSYLKLGISDNHKPSPKGMESRMEGLAPSSVRKADGENMKVVCSNLNSFSTHSKLTEINNVFTKENQSVSPDKHEKPKTCKVGKKKVEGTKLKLLV